MIPTVGRILHYWKNAKPAPAEGDESPSSPVENPEPAIIVHIPAEQHGQTLVNLTIFCRPSEGGSLMVHQRNVPLVEGDPPMVGHYATWPQRSVPLVEEAGVTGPIG